MSKAIPFFAGASKNAAAVDAVTKVLGAVGVSLSSVDAAGLSGSKVVLSTGLSAEEQAKLGSPVHTSVVSTKSAALNPDTTFASADFTVFRSVIPSEHAVSVVDRLDKFPKLGISVASETECVKASITATAEAAVAKASALGTKVVVFQKPQSAFKGHNSLFTSTVKEVAEAAGVSVEVMHSQQVFNNAIMFSESLGVVVAPAYSSSELLEEIATGVAGGVGMASKVLKTPSTTIYSADAKAGANPTGLLLAATDALEALGMSAEAAKVKAAVTKVYTAAKTLPAGVKGGSAEPAVFGDAVKAAMA